MSHSLLLSGENRPIPGREHLPAHSLDSVEHAGAPSAYFELIVDLYHFVCKRFDVMRFITQEEFDAMDSRDNRLRYVGYATTLLNMIERRVECLVLR